MRKFLCKNYADRQIKFDGHSVPSGAYYGQTAEGLRFIAVVRVNQIGMVWRSGKGLVPWEKSYNQTVVDFIRSEPVGVNSETCLLYTSPSPRDGLLSRMPSSA